MFELLLGLLVTAATPFSPVTPASSSDHADEAVERAARDYRIRIYDTFHRDRPEYDSRREAGDRVLSGYRRSGQRPDHGEILESWFAQARAASSPDQIGPLPELPDFAAEFPAEPDSARAAADSTAVGGRQASADKTADLRTSEAAAANRSFQMSVAGKVGGALLRAAMRTPNGSTAEPLPQLHIEVGRPNNVDGNELAVDEHIDPIIVDTGNMTPVAPENPGDLASQPAAQPNANEPAIDPQPELPDTEEVADASTAPEAPVAADPSPTEPAVEVEQEVSVVPSAAAQRLATRVTRFNHALNELVAETAVDSPAKLFDIARLLNDLVELAGQRPEIASELAALSPAEREAVPDLLPIEPAVTGLQATMIKTRTELDTGNFFGSDAERQQAQQLLDVLEKQLLSLASDA